MVHREPPRSATISKPNTPPQGRPLLSLVNRTGLNRAALYARRNEFLSPYGIRALSRYHRDHPYVPGQRHDLSCRLRTGRIEHGSFRRHLELARADLVSGQLISLIESLQKFHFFSAIISKSSVPRAPANDQSLGAPAGQIFQRLTRLFLRDEKGRRPVFGGTENSKTILIARSIPFYEYFHGDNGAGIGASHQTGWTRCPDGQIDSAVWGVKPQHDQKIIDDFNSFPFRSFVKLRTGSELRRRTPRGFFSWPARTRQRD